MLKNKALLKFTMNSSIKIKVMKSIIGSEGDVANLTKKIGSCRLLIHRHGVHRKFF